MALPAKFVRDALGEPLGELRFRRVGRRNVWMRSGDGIDHAISLEGSHGSLKVRWDVVHPGVGEMLHGRLADPADVAYSGVVTGRPAPSLRPGVIASFHPNDVDDRDDLTVGVRAAALQVADWLDGFAGTGDVISYLTEDLNTADPCVVFPERGPVRLFVAAGLAVSQRTPGAQELTLRAIESLALFTDPLTRQRIQRLNAALA